MSDDAKVQAIRARRAQEKTLEAERTALFKLIKATHDKAVEADLYKRYWKAGGELESLGMYHNYDTHIDALLDALAQAVRERDAAVAALDELAAWVDYGDWHHASPELARKVYAVLGKRDYLPRYTWDVDAPADDA